MLQVDTDDNAEASETPARAVKRARYTSVSPHDSSRHIATDDDVDNVWGRESVTVVNRRRTLSDPGEGAGTAPVYRPWPTVTTTDPSDPSCRRNVYGAPVSSGYGDQLLGQHGGMSMFTSPEGTNCRRQTLHCATRPLPCSVVLRSG